jgi:hypothetical protein
MQADSIIGAEPIGTVSRFAGEEGISILVLVANDAEFFDQCLAWIVVTNLLQCAVE